MDGPTNIALSAQIAQRSRLDTTASNIANMNTAGFRPDRMVFQSHVSRLATPGREVAMVQDRATYTERRQGPIQVTGNPLDLAIDGEALMAVESPGGRAYTRDGRLKTAADGTLVDGSGRAILDEGGGRIQLPDNYSSLDVRHDGSIVALVEGQPQPVGRIGLFSPSQPNALRKSGDGLYQAPANTMTPVEADARAARLIQGAIEGSGVNGVVEIANLTEAQRAYERIARIVTDDDSRLRRMVDTLARNPN